MAAAAAAAAAAAGDAASTAAADSASSSSSSSSEPEVRGTPVTFTLKHSKTEHSVTFGSDNTLAELRQLLQGRTGVLAALQKVMYKGLQKDDSKTLAQMRITDGVKVMLVGSSMDAVMRVTTRPTGANAAGAGAGLDEEEKVDRQAETKHKKILDKGAPDSAMPGFAGKNESLPEGGLSGILNNIGIRVRLTLKTFTEELWVQTASNSQRIPFAQIRNVVHEPIKDNAGYHMVGLELGRGDASTLWLYWVPAQYVNALKYTLLGDYS